MRKIRSCSFHFNLVWNPTKLKAAPGPSSFGHLLNGQRIARRNPGFFCKTHDQRIQPAHPLFEQSNGIILSVKGENRIGRTE